MKRSILQIGWSLVGGRQLGLALGSVAVLGSISGCSLESRESMAAPIVRPSPPVNEREAASKPPSLPATRDPKEILRRTSAALRASRSVRIGTETELKYVVGRLVMLHQTTEIVAARNPPRLFLSIRDPGSGTVRYVYSGGVLSAYHGISNTYRQSSVGTSMSSAVAAIDEENPQVLSPLVFMVAQDVPQGLTDLRLVGTETMGKRRALKVQGRFTPSFMANMAKKWFSGSPQPASRDFTIWIDSNSFEMIRSFVTIGWKGRVNLKGAPKQFVQDPRVQFTEVVTSYSTDSPVSDKDFTFVPPQGAQSVPWK